jgi:hypothetical protein
MIVLLGRSLRAKVFGCNPRSDVANEVALLRRAIAARTRDLISSALRTPKYDSI